ncbi:MAG: transcription-repair coupling factor [Bacteroidia bacterium]|nr:transcription-repair coupling factor [Bacteroidia bacterium]MCX7651671.1 transcription-repair coupling factor [Bacteroidia bacterium]MDW8417205.1 transcription-repair coupling factor [Bacteroidia bacterium]
MVDELRLPFPDNHPRPIHIDGLRGSAAALWIAQYFAQIERPILVVLPHMDAAQALLADLRLFTEAKASTALLPHSTEAPHALLNAYLLERSYYLTRLLLGERLCLVCPASFLSERLPHPDKWRNHLFELKVGSSVDREFFVELLRTYDFVEVSAVNAPGEYAWRGAVIDVFSYAHPYPLRLRFEGDVLTRLNRFNLETQLSEGELLGAFILPAYSAIEESPSTTLSDFIPSHAEVIFVEGQATLAQLHRTTGEYAEQILRPLAAHSVELGHEPAFQPQTTLSHITHPQPSFPHNLSLFYEHLRLLPLRSLHVYVENEKQQLRVQRLLSSVELPYPVHYHLGSLSGGFYDPANQVAFYTDHQIFKRFYAPPVHRSFRRSEALALRELYELQIGDFVVHRQYGIAQYGGLATLPKSDPPQEGIKLIFADDAVVYVPISQVGDIGRYRALGEAEPKLTRLGSSEWQRTTEKVRKRLREIALDLVKLYAKRRMQHGYAFSPDTLQQLEMESRFPYEETPDQLQAISEIKKDMESPYPMDRLLCGDVGFGKTEVAIRAAFKAVQDGKQVAFLAPTTVLVMQHLRTLEARLEGFPVRIAALSRLQSPKEQKSILKKLMEGEIDIIVGTHRLLSEDVKFHDLGLLIIDEEHKFGVVAKEKLRAMYPTVDTLSMSATPIPRTLQMALQGIRSISLMVTPPKNRLPVETKVRPFSWELVKEALSYELNRAGQAFFVHNQIKELPKITQKIKELLPEAEVTFVHAQMPARQVEDTLLAFLYQQIDVLVTTNLVESGLDLPNVNTIIVHHAHRFGLSDLHQLRGRVGRGGRQAYCYLLIPGLHFLSSDALRRLEALEEFSDLGSGFQIAMRDLELRGAGDLFGREQSGFIAEIGYDLYQRYLEEAIAQIREEEGLDIPLAQSPSQPQCSVDCDWAVRLPESWIPYPATRLEVYHKLSTASDERHLQNILRELMDRFGTLPPEVLTLADVMRLRWLGDQLRLPYIQVRRQKVRLPLPSDSPIQPILEYMDKQRPRIPFQFIPHQNILLMEVSEITSPKHLIAFLEGLSQALSHPEMAI